MARRVKREAAAAEPARLGATATTHRTAMVPFASLRMAAYNPRTTTDAQVNGICRSILQFGIVDPFVVREEDNLLIGGHQRAKAITKLLEGRYIDPGTSKSVAFELPGGEVPAVLVSGLSDKDAKLLNLALNKVGGEWDDDKLAALFTELVDTRQGESFDELVVSGFTAAEIADYVDIAATVPDADGTGPLPGVRSPKLTLDFSSKEVRDMVKARIVARNATEPSGDVLARLLKVLPKRAAASE